MTHLLRIIGMTAVTLLLIGAAFAMAVGGAVLAYQSVTLGVAGNGDHSISATSDPCVSVARMTAAVERPTVC